MTCFVCPVVICCGPVALHTPTFLRVGKDDSVTPQYSFFSLRIPLRCQAQVRTSFGAQGAWSGADVCDTPKQLLSPPGMRYRICGTYREASSFHYAVAAASPLPLLGRWRPRPITFMSRRHRIHAPSTSRLRPAHVTPRPPHVLGYSLSVQMEVPSGRYHLVENRDAPD